MKPLHRIVSVALAFLSTQVALGADDPLSDPLPQGAKLRIGTTRLTFPNNTHVELLPPDYKTLLVVSDKDDTVQRFDVGTGRALGALKAEIDYRCRSFVVSANGKRAVVPGNPIIVRDIATGEKVAAVKQLVPLDQSNQHGPGCALSADGRILAYGGAEFIRDGAGPNAKIVSTGGFGTVFVWDIDKIKLLTQVRTIQRGPASSVLSADGTLLATYGWHNTFDPRPPEPKPGLPGVVRAAPEPEEVRIEPDPGRTVQVWSVATGKELFRAQITGTGAYVVAVAFSADGKTLAASAADGPVELWDVKTGKRLHTLLGRTHQGSKLAFSPDGKTVAAATHNAIVQRWTVSDGRALGTTRPPTELPGSWMAGLAFENNDRLLAWGWRPGRAAVVWDVLAAKVLTPPRDDVIEIYSLGFAADGKELVTSVLTGEITRWDSTTGKKLGTIALRRDGLPPYAVALASNAARGFSDYTDTFFDLATGEELFVLPRAPHVGKPGFPVHNSTRPSPDLKWIACLSDPDGSPGDPPRIGGACVVWDVERQRKVAEIELPKAHGWRTAGVTPSGTRLVTVTRPYREQKNVADQQDALIVTGWDLKTGKKLAELEIEQEGTRWGSTVAVASESTVVIASQWKLWTVDFERGKKGEEFDALRDDEKGVFGPLAVSADGKYLAAGAPTKTPGAFAVRVYDWRRGKPLHTFTGHRGAVTALCFSPDGKTLASGSEDTTVLLWDLSAIEKK